MKYFYLVFCFAIGYICPAQNFNYVISLDPAYSYTELTGATILTSQNKWLPRYEVPTGFSSGKIQSVVIETNGFVVYNQHLNLAVMAFHGYTSKQDSAGNRSRLSYKTTGTEGNKVLKIEYKHVGVSADPAEWLDYQVWIKENGVFDVVLGPNTYEPQAGDTLIDTNRVIHIGLVNRNTNTTERGVFVSGTPASPLSVPVNDEHPEFSFLRTVPKRGYKYTFTPTQN